MKIFILVDQMAVGGAGRVASILINGLIERGHEVIMETDCSMPVNYPIPDNAIMEPRNNIRSRSIQHRILYRFESWRHHRRLLKHYRPDVAVAFLPTMFWELYVSAIGLNIPIVASDHTSMSRDVGIWHNFIRHHLYGLGRATTILTQKDKAILGSRVKNKVVVNNPLTYNPVISTPMQSRGRTVLCAGRLNSWGVKGIDRMIDIWGRISADFPDWTLELAGHGDSVALKEINEMISRAAVEGHVRLLGNVSDMQSLYQQTSVFALPSRVEGFPMVLIEAMSQGCACVTFSLDGAIGEIVNSGVDGIIVPDNDLAAFEYQLRRVMADQSMREEIGKSACENVARFSVEKFMDAWENILVKATE